MIINKHSIRNLQKIKINFHKWKKFFYTAHHHKEKKQKEYNLWWSDRLVLQLKKESERNE